MVRFQPVWPRARLAHGWSVKPQGLAVIRERSANPETARSCECPCERGPAQRHALVSVRLESLLRHRGLRSAVTNRRLVFRSRMIMSDRLAGLPPRFLRTSEARFLGLSGRILENASDLWDWAKVPQNRRPCRLRAWRSEGSDRSRCQAVRLGSRQGDRAASEARLRGLACLRHPSPAAD